MNKALEHCHGCNRLMPLQEMFAVEVFVAKQTQWSPAEYDSVHVCRDCFMAGDVDDGYERASVIWRQKHGWEL